MEETATGVGPETAGDSVPALPEGLGPEAGVGAESVASWQTETGILDSIYIRQSLAGKPLIMVNKECLTFAGAAPPPTCCGARRGLDPVTLGCRGYRRAEEQPALSAP